MFFTLCLLLIFTEHPMAAFLFKSMAIYKAFIDSLSFKINKIEDLK